MRVLSNFISYLFHPVFIPLYAIIFMLVSNPYRYESIQSINGGYLVIYVTMYTVALPLLILFFIKKFNLIDSFKMKDRGERLLPLMIMIFFCFFAFLALRKSAFHPDIAGVMLGASIALMLAYMTTAFANKISLHAIGMGALVAVVMHCAMYSAYSVYGFLFLAVLIAGLVGTARLFLGAHEPREVYMGYLYGYFIQMLVLIF